MNDSLFVEEIDLGDVGVRQVVSGLAKYMKEEDISVFFWREHNFKHADNILVTTITFPYFHFLQSASLTC